MSSIVAVVVDRELHLQLVAAQRVDVLELEVRVLQLAPVMRAACSARGCSRGRGRPSSANTSRTVPRPSTAGRRRRAWSGRRTTRASWRATPRRRISGCAQWWPARTQTPWRPRISATSCGWTPSSANEHERAARARASAGRAASGPGPRAGARARSRRRRARARTRVHADARRATRRRRRARSPRRSASCPPRTSRAARPTSTRRSVDAGDHVPAAEERRHRLEQLAAAVQHADAGRPVGLVAGPGVEVGAERGDVDRQVRHGLRAVDQHDRAGGVRAARDLVDRVDRAEHVGDVGDGDELRARARAARRARRGRAARRRRSARTRARRRPPREHLPRHEVRVVLHLRQRPRGRRRRRWRGPTRSATRLIASVALRVKTVSPGGRAGERGDARRARPRRRSVASAASG